MRKQWLFLLASLLMAVPVLAQRTTAVIQGTISDPTGAIVVGAKVTAVAEGTGFTRSTTTNSAGAYSFGDLPVGTYRLEVEHPGFKLAARSGVLVNVADVRAVDVELQTGELTEVVNVEMPAVAVQTVGGDVSGLVTGEQVRELPLNGRNFLQLATLMPGVSAPDVLNVKDKGLLGGSDLSVSRQRGHLQPVDGRRRQQQRRRLEPHHPRLPVGGGDRGVQDPPQHLRRRVRAGGGRADQHRDAGRHQRVPRQRLLLRPQRRAELEELLPGADRPGEGEAEAERLRLHVRRTAHEGQAALLRLAGVEPRAARHRAPGARAHRRRARGRLQRRAHRRLLLADPERSGHRAARSPATGFPPTGSARAACSTCSSTRCPTPTRRGTATTGWSP